MTKRILAFVCVLALLMGTPISPLEAAAATTGDILNYCPCMGTHTSTSQCKNVNWEPWDSATTLPSSGNYYLTRNVYVPNSTELMGTLNLDLNGKTVKGNNGLFTMASGDHLVVTDSATGGSLGAAGVPVVANAGSKLTVYSATIGGTVKDNGATVTLCGKPSVYVSMADNSPAMKCEGLQKGSSVYVMGPLGLCFAKVDSADQKSLFSVQNEYGVRYENGGLYLTSKQTHCVCAGTQAGSSYGHVCEQVTWEPWVDEAGKAITDSLPTATGNYYLTEDVYLTTEQAITAGDTVRLDLNGKTVYASQALDSTGTLVTNKGTRVYYIPSGSTLEITSSVAGAGTISTLYNDQPTDRGKYGGTIYADEGSVLRLYRGTLQGTEQGSTFPIHGGCVYNLGTFQMYGGTIQDGKVTGQGGCVYSEGTFQMYGGTIKSGIGTGFNVALNKVASNAEIGGTATINGGLAVRNNATLTLTGAPSISHNSYACLNLNDAHTKVIDATGLETGAKIRLSVAASETHPATRNVIKVANATQAACFTAGADVSASYGVHCDANGYISMHALTDTRYGCLCGGKLAGTDGHTCQLLTWQPWSATDSLPTSGNYYLTADVAVTAATAVTGELNLDLYGHTVTATGSSRVYDVTGTLRITDSGSAGAVNASGAAFVYDYTYANVHDSTNHGGVIRATGGTVELYGGTFTGAGNVACGGVLAATDATVKLYGGTYTGSAAVYGGGLYLANTAFTMYGGTITGCSAGEGGSIYLAASCNAVIKGGTVSGGTANDYTDPDDTTNVKTAVGGNIRVAADAQLTLEDGIITGGVIAGAKGNGGNIAVNGTAYIKGGVVTQGSATNIGDNIYVGGSLFVSGGEVKDPAEGYNIGLWNGSTVTVSGGKITGGTYGIYNGSKGGNTVLQGNAVISGTTYGIHMNNPYQNTGTEAAPVYALRTDYTLGTLTVDSSFTGSADVYWGNATANHLGITTGAEIEGTVSNGYTGDGNLVYNKDGGIPLVGGAGGKLVLAAAAIADGDGVRKYYTSFDEALAAYELASNSADQNYLMLLIDQTDVAITKTVYLDLNGCDISVASVSADCKIYGMDSKTNQYTQYAENGTTSIIGSLTLGSGVDATCMVEDVHVNLTKGTTKGTRKYLALLQSGAYTFHRYYLTLSETGLRPADAGIFYNATFYGDEAIAGLVESYGVEVSTASTFEAGSTASSNYQTSSAFQSGVLGNKGSRTVLTGIISADGSGADYSKENIYGRAYLTVNGVTLYCSNTGVTNLQSIITKADVAYGKNGLSTAQKDALNAMFNTYRTVMDSWNILNNIGRIEIDINDLFAKDPAEDDELNILLIGNSFCYYWVQELFWLLAEGSGYAKDKITIVNVYYSGCSLEQHWNWLQTGAANYNIAVTQNGTGYTIDTTLFESLDTVITGSRAKSWDFISLQQNSPAYYSGDGSSVGNVDYARETLEPYLGNLLGYLRSYYPKAEYMWHQFWSHELGFTMPNGNTITKARRTSFHNALVSIGNEVSQLYDMTVVPTGEAWELVRDNTLFTTPHASSTLTTQSLCTRIRNNAFYDDLYHDGDIGGGQYLNACVWYEKITGKSVVGTTYRPSYKLDSSTTVSLTEDQIDLLQYAAHAAVAKYTPNSDPSLDNEFNVLLIGNSFCYWWPDELAGMLKAAGYTNVNIYNVYTSGCKLQQHWTGYQGKLTGFDNNGNGTLDSASDEIIQFRLNGSLVIEGTTLYDCITAKNWDFISLQQSGTPVYGTTGGVDKLRSSVEPYTSYLLSTLRGMYPLAEYCWLQSWAHEVYNANAHDADTGVADLTVRAEKAEVFRTVANELCEKYSLTKIPCGDAWELVRDNSLVSYKSGTQYYDLTSRSRANGTIFMDGEHDGDICGGQYLNACVWFEMLTRTSCVGNTFVPTYYNTSGTTTNLSTAQINLLQNGAHSAVAAIYGSDYAK